ncbi:hypothetical protein F4679DRAFT_595065 [Xylaria curta]|nr:hypothetical protein F4679DRAFT_595065 [Xylaria curta]
MPTLLKVLTQPNLEVDRRFLKPGGNTTVNTNIYPQSWRPWSEFNYANLTRVFSRELGSQYKGPRIFEQPLPQDQVLFHEDTLEDFLRRFIVPVVNYCLDQSEGQPHFGRGSRCGGNEDWSVVSPSRVCERGNLMNHLPGDSKVSSKWWTAMKDDDSRFLEWQKPVAQLILYMLLLLVRYGFIFTDEALIVTRLNRTPIGGGLAADRPQRQVVTPATGQERPISDISVASSGTSSFQDDDPLNWEYDDPEYVEIPWAAHGKRLTIKLALWCLAMMAVNGDNYIDYSYPPLDSWRASSDGQFIHNTSGAVKEHLEAGDHYEEPNPHWPAGEEEARDDIVQVAEGVTAMDVVGEDISISSLAGSLDSDKGKQRARDESNDEDGDKNDNDSGNHNRDMDDASQDRILLTRTRMKRRGYNKKLYYQDYKEKWHETRRRDWKKAKGGYVFRGKKHVYFVVNIPK